MVIALSRPLEVETDNLPGNNGSGEVNDTASTNSYVTILNLDISAFRDFEITIKNIDASNQIFYRVFVSLDSASSIGDSDASWIQEVGETTLAVVFGERKTIKNTVRHIRVDIKSVLAGLHGTAHIWYSYLT